MVKILVVEVDDVIVDVPLAFHSFPKYHIPVDTNHPNLHTAKDWYFWKQSYTMITNNDIKWQCRKSSFLQSKGNRILQSFIFMLHLSVINTTHCKSISHHLDKVIGHNKWRWNVFFLHYYLQLATVHRRNVVNCSINFILIYYNESMNVFLKMFKVDLIYIKNILSIK